jgi:hypothetical protein
VVGPELLADLQDVENQGRRRERHHDGDNRSAGAHPHRCGKARTAEAIPPKATMRGDSTSIPVERSAASPPPCVGTPGSAWVASSW